MSDATTPHLGLVLPTVGADSDSWGQIINDDLSHIDALFATTGTNALGSAALMSSADPRFMSAGMIVLWSGAAAAIPAGWHLCDGTSGTPDLRDRFVIGAGASYGVGAAGGAIAQAVAIAPHALSQAELPAYNLTVSNDSHSHSTTEQPHTHNFNLVSGGTGGIANALESNGGFVALEDVSAASTNLTVDTASTNIVVSSAGGNQAHDHAGSYVPDVRPPYYALCFIMKL